MIFSTLAKLPFSLLIFLLLSACSSSKHVQTDLQDPPKADAAVSSPTSTSASQSEEVTIPGFEETQDETTDENLEEFNRTMFTFNDRLYFWVMKPVLTGYNWALPEAVRKSVRNFFYNIDMPLRFVSSTLQAEPKAMGIELARFTINSTLGVAGFFDVANSTFYLGPQVKDLGQTLGKYGFEEGPFLVWPFFGPSTMRDTVGSLGELFLTPWRLLIPFGVSIFIDSYQYFNKASLDANQYEELVSSAVEPYSALKNAYLQYRRNIVKNK